MKNTELIEKIKHKFSLQTDSDLAAVLGEKPHIVSGWKTNRRPIPLPIKLRILEHIEFSTEIRRLAAVLVDDEEQRVQITQDLDRLEEVKRRQAGLPVNFAEQKWIERVKTLQTTQGLNEMQAAKYLEMSSAELAEVKAGERELTLGQKTLLLGLLAVKAAVNKETLKRKLNERVEKS